MSNQAVMFRVYDLTKKSYRIGGLLAYDGRLDNDDDTLVVLEMYTQCVDRNGLPIYEGDKVKLCRSLSYQNRKGEVGVVTSDPVELGYVIVANGYSITRLTPARSKNMEVVGNKHNEEF